MLVTKIEVITNIFSCHQQISSPISVINIDVTSILVFNISMIFRLDASNISSSSLSTDDMKQFPYCSDYLLSRGFNNRQPSQDEREFPIAYSIVVHSHFGMVERLIRSIWRPQERFYQQP